MKKAVSSTQPYRTQKQKSLSILANTTSVIGHTSSVFTGIAVGTNISKIMKSNGVNSGVSTATGCIVGIAAMIGGSIATECVSGAIRKKANIPSPFSMLCTGHDFDPEDYSSILKNIKEEGYDALPEDNYDEDGSLLRDTQEPDHESDN